MKADPTLVLYVVIGVHALAVLLLLVVDRRKAPPEDDAHRQPPAEPTRAAERPRVRSEERLVENLARWRAHHAGGEILPVPADGGRGTRQTSNGLLA